MPQYQIRTSNEHLTVGLIANNPLKDIGNKCVLNLFKSVFFSMVIKTLRLKIIYIFQLPKLKLLKATVQEHPTNLFVELSLKKIFARAYFKDLL